jgi:hypothetical protein
MNDLSTISGIIDALINIHCEEKSERAIIMFNCAYGLLKLSSEYATDFDDKYRNENDKYAFDLTTDTLCEAFSNASKRLNEAIRSKQE